MQIFIGGRPCDGNTFTIASDNLITGCNVPDMAGTGLEIGDVVEVYVIVRGVQSRSVTFMYTTVPVLINTPIPDEDFQIGGTPVFLFSTSTFLVCVLCVCVCVCVCVRARAWR